MTTSTPIKDKIKTMTLEEKIGQKVMLDFRYWNEGDQNQNDMITPNATIEKLLTHHHIGGVILFSNNLKNKKQIKALTSWYASMRSCKGARLFIGTDNEGGNVFRLPRDEYASYPGNMALAAAIEGGANVSLANEQGREMAKDMQSLHINTNFAPVVDINTNPFNPVINVRAFSDDVHTACHIAEHLTAGMKRQGLITAYKHFPGHGSTSTDSHTGLPRVDRSREDAFAIDIAPYRCAIDNQLAPDMIMTAHIQYPALDNSQITTRTGVKITVPATMSREIQTTILRGDLGYTGVTISDALDMAAIVDHFNQDNAIAHVFSAGVDIALMPISMTSSSHASRLSHLIQGIAGKIRKGLISEADIDASVERILTLKQRHGLLDETKVITNEPVHAEQNLEKLIADRSITVVINRESALPLEDVTLRYFILTPAKGQADGISVVMRHHGYQHVVAANEQDASQAEILQHIAACDVFLIGTASTSFVPTAKEEDVTFRQNNHTRNKHYADWLHYATALGKVRIHLSLRAPYDIVNYSNCVDAAVASYSYLGYENETWRGPSMASLAKVLMGKLAPKGKLPVNTWHDYDVDTNSGTVAYPKGFGESW